MHISNALSIAENFNTEGIHNIIVNLLQVVLVDTPVLSPHAFTQLEPYIPLKVDALIHIKVRMSIIPRGIHIGPRPESLRRYPRQFDKVTLISREFLRQLPACYNNLSIILSAAPLKMRCV